MPITEELVAELSKALVIADIKEQCVPSDKFIFIVERIGKLKIEIFFNEHPPPHFRVSCNEGSCRFLIKNGTPLDSDGLSQHFREIKKWHKKHKQDLTNTWNLRRPTDCPVGEYCE